MARLGDIATYINGYAFKPTDWSEQGLPIIRIQDLTGNSYQANHYNGKYDTKYEVVSGDVLISWSASLGIYVWQGEKALLNQHIFKVVFDKADVDKSFFIHQLKAILEKAKGDAHGATMKHLTKPVFDALPFYLPSKEKQVQIATELNTVCKLIEQRKEQIIKLDELVKARFVEMFGDPITNTKKLTTNDLKDVLMLKAGDFTEASDISDKPNEENKYPCYGGNGIRGYVAGYNQEGEYSLIGRQGALSGNVQFAKGKFKNTEHALLVTPLVKMNNVWLNQLLINLDLRRYQTGAAQPGLSVKNLQEIQIVVVPIEEQEYFATFVKQIDKSKFEVQQSLEKLETLKKSLMQQYFG